MTSKKQTVQISVDGQDGEVISRQRGVRVVPNNDSWALVPIGAKIDGAPGTNAASAVAGGPGGAILVELTESERAPGQIHVDVVHFEARQRPPAAVQIPVGKDLLLTARGGTGEAGHDGGDGQNGSDGQDGNVATRESDATDGAAGGKGGNAGVGTSGANGGLGGTIQVLVTENNMHLLMAVQHDVSGGKGGVSGKHGKPGQGGKGGKGGSGHKWTELVGYKYYCTSNCVGRDDNVQSSESLTLTKARIVSSALVSAVRVQAVSGQGLQQLIAQTAALHGARTRRIADPGNCSCAGGIGNCAGCGYKAIEKRFERPKALDGSGGIPGKVVTTEITSGADGVRGTFSIHVRDDAGNIHFYDSPYRLELVDFDLEDENGDGIFEPGECVVVRRVRVRNTGGMPSPTCSIAVRIVPSKGLIPEGLDALFLPQRIEAGSTVTLEGQARARIEHPAEHPAIGQTFSRQVSVSLAATMPWLDRDLPNFQVTKSFLVEYPFELQDLSCLASLTQGASGRVTWKVYNKSNLSAHPQNEPARTLQVTVSIPKNFGSLKSHDVDQTLVNDENERESIYEEDQEVDNIGPKRARNMETTLTSSLSCPNHSRLPIDLTLHLDDPQMRVVDSGDDDTMIELIPIHRLRLEIQISTSHYFNKDAAFLLLTNSKAPRNRVQAITKFISDELGMFSDQWNVDVYGGLSQVVADEDDDSTRHILERYRGKSIIVLGNAFEFFDAGSKTIAQLCDPRVIAYEASYRTSFLFLDAPNNSTFESLVQQVVHPIPQTMSQVKSGATIDINHSKEMITSIAEEFLVGAKTPESFILPVTPRWYNLWMFDPHSQARDISKVLQTQLPLFRGTVSVATSLTNTNTPGDKKGQFNLRSRARAKARQHHLVVNLGQTHDIAMTVINSISGGSKNRLSELEPFEKYHVISSLSASTRVSMLWCQGQAISSWPDFSDSIISMTELTLTLAVSNEINRYTHETMRPVNTTYLANAGETKTHRFFKLHLPCIALLFTDPIALTQVDEVIPTAILNVLSHALACCKPQRKRELTYSPRRRALRVVLIDEVNSLLTRKNYSADRIRAFHTSTNLLHSIKDSSKRNTHDLIVSKAAELTQCAKFNFKARHKTSSDLVPQTVYISPQEWDQRYTAVEDSVKEVKRIETIARNRLEKMLVDEPNVEFASGSKMHADIVELPSSASHRLSISDRGMVSTRNSVNAVGRQDRLGIRGLNPGNKQSDSEDDGAN